MKSLTNSTEALFDPGFYTRIHRASQTLSREQQWHLYRICLIGGDILLTGLAFSIAFWIRFNSDLPFFRLDVTPSLPFYRNLVLILVPLWFLIFASSGLYTLPNLLGGTEEYALVFRATSIGMLLVVLAGFLEPDFVLARGWLLMAWILAFFCVALGRFLMRRAVYYLRRHGYFLSSALIIGANEEARSLAQQLLSWQTSGLHILGFIDDKVPVGASIYSNLHTLGSTAELDRLIARYNIRELILATSALSRDEMVDFFTRYGMDNDINVRFSSGLFEIITTGLQVNEFAYVPLVRVNKVRLTGLDHLMKFILDYSITIPALIALLPALLLIGLAIKMDSPGPVIYRRRVMGLNGRQFDAYKFRTMHVNSSRILAAYPGLQRELAENHKLKNDPRVTRIGQILRKLSLDELPQLVNVLRREMSLVGPRMIAPDEMSKYNQLGTNLLTVTPGITGLWQVSGRSDISYDERVRLDMQYIRNWSIWLDFQLLLQTIPAVIKGRGAY